MVSVELRSLVMVVEVAKDGIEQVEWVSKNKCIMVFEQRLLEGVASGSVIARP